MQRIYRVLWVCVMAGLCLPAVVSASALKTFSGTITKINNNQITFSTTSAAKYTADLANAVLVRKNGAVMQLPDFLVGDKVQIIGTLWADNSVSATKVQDNSLYAHTGTYTGKIITMDPTTSSFTMQSKAHGTQTVTANNFTAFSVNGSNASFNALALGMTATVKGMWDRTNANLTATKIAGTFRMINIYFTGKVTMASGSGITVIGNGNVIYGVDTSNAQILGKDGKPLSPNVISIGDTVRVWGKHISGTVQIAATKVKDSSRP